ncbi:fumarylacetoacetate (FAA) hydrolase [Oxalobacteraceae bacterium GrIS 2.11]
MKLATLKDGSRDGQLTIVSRDLKTAVIATNIAPTMQDLLDSWDFMQPQCEDLYVQLNQGRAAYSFDFDPTKCMAPLPRAYQFVDASAYLSYVDLMCQARGTEMPELFHSEPLLHQAASDDFVGACDPVLIGDEAWGIDFESEIAIVTGDLAMGSRPDQLREQVRLVMLANDITLRELIPNDMIKGFGFFQSKPTSSFSPVAVTPDELGEAWSKGKLHLPLRSSVNGKLLAQPDAGVDMTFSFPQLLAQMVKTRHVRAGTIVGSGTVFNKDINKGCSSLYGMRALESVAGKEVTTSYLHFGDIVKIEMLDKNGKSIFGAIEQQIEQFAKV